MVLSIVSINRSRRCAKCQDQLQIVSPLGSVDTSSPRSSILFRLVDLASRTLKQCAPEKGHLAARYALFLRRLADGLASGPARMPVGPETNGQRPSENPGLQLETDGTGGNGGPIWDGNWLTLLQNSGLPDWPFDGDAGNLGWA